MRRNQYVRAAPLLCLCAICFYSYLAHCTKHADQDDQHDEIEEAAGENSHRFIVVFRPHVTDSSAALEKLRSYTIGAPAGRPATGAPMGAPMTGLESRNLLLHRVIGSELSPDSTDQVATSSNVHQVTSAAAAASGVQGLLLSATPTIASKLWQSPDVAAVIPDTLVQTQRHLTAETGDQCMDCSQAASLTTKGISVTPNSRFKWPECYNPLNTQLVWTGHLCGPTRDQVIYTSVEALDDATGELKPGCKLTASMDQPASWLKQRFGSCGKAPLHAPSLPTQLCDMQTVSDCPTNNLDMTAEASTEPTDAFPARPESPQALVLPREALKGQEDVPSGVSRILAYRRGTITRIPRDLPANKQVAIGGIDSGVYAQHPDLNVVGGKSFVKNDGTLESLGQGRSFQVMADDLDPKVDKYGHGTHIAGIVGARNQGYGIIGVSPGAPLFALKVNNAYGKGAMSWVLESVKWVVTTGLPQHKIRVINLSLSFYISPSTPSYQQMKDAVCTFFDEATKAGVVVVAAAGNQGISIEGHFPASCPGVAAVTALDASGKAAGGYSNYWPVDTVTDEVKVRTFLAPGTGIISTVSPQVSRSLFYTLQGTSQASPHVAAVAANCLMSGACPVQLSGKRVISMLQKSARRKTTAEAGYALPGVSSGGKFYGSVVYAAY